MNYRREIDGLRAVAVLPVILFHAGFSGFSGGYVGVDVFFVISGYLITSILIVEIERGDFSIAHFYERRARRILPALFVVMLACLPFAYMWMLPSQLEDFSQSLVAASLFISNWLFWSESGYFGANAELKPLLHTWSLSIEEQYYLAFPILMLFLWRFSRKFAFCSIMILSICSLLLSEWGWRNGPEVNFFFSFSRFWELLAGSICAFLSVGRAQRSSNVLSSAGLALILLAIFAYDANTPFPSVYTLVPVVGTALIILFAAKGTWAARLLSMRGFVGIGLISYSAYLWHQPLFAFARLRSLTEPSHSLMAGLAVTALLLAWATWYYIEQVFRKRANPVFATPRSVFLASGAVGAVFVTIGMAGHIGKGFEWRWNGDVSVADLDERLIINYGLHADCGRAFNNSVNCRTSEDPNVLLWGDSYAMHLAQGILADEESVALQQYTMSVCAPVLNVAHVGVRYTEEWAQRCIAFNSQVIQWLNMQDDVDLVILSSPFSQLLGDVVLMEDGELLTEPSVSFIAEQVLESVRKIRGTGANVVIVSPTPHSGWDNGQCIVRSIYFGLDEANCNFSLDISSEVYDLLRLLEKKVRIFWIHENVCDESICKAFQDGVLIYRDHGHLSKEGSEYLGRRHSWMATFRQISN